jgi:pyrimidine-specific ribonucleoside hydrolase
VKPVVLLITAALAAIAAEPVWIDTDPSVARGGHEIDDGFALGQAFGHHLAVRGVSVVYGNAPLATALPIGREIVRLFGPAGMPVYAGAASANELGKETEATRALAAALRKETLTVLVLGPATNVASVLKLHPDLGKRMRKIIAVAGRRPGQVFRVGSSPKPLRDFNFENDREAFQVILDSKVPVVLAPFEISSKVWVKKADLDARRGNRAIDWLYEPALDWLAVWKRDFGVDGFNPFDTLAVGYVIAPEKLMCETVPAKIESGDLVAAREVQSARRVLYCSAIRGAGSPAPDFLMP